MSVRVERVGATHLVTIDRPAAGNAINSETTRALLGAVADARADRKARAFVLTGAGDRFFCAGGDLKEYRGLTTRAKLASGFGRTRKLLDALEALPLPVIAAVNGWALGGGSELLLACDLRFAGTTARIGFPQLRLGLIPGWNGTERLVETVGRGTAMWLLLTGHPLSAAEAHRVGLVQATVGEGSVVQAALDFAEGLSQIGPLAVDAAKRALLEALRLPHRESRKRSSKRFADLWFSTDHREAEAAFVEKRKPQFRGL